MQEEEDAPRCLEQMTAEQFDAEGARLTQQAMQDIAYRQFRDKRAAPAAAASNGRTLVSEFVARGPPAAVSGPRRSLSVCVALCLAAVVGAWVVGSLQPPAVLCPLARGDDPISLARLGCVAKLSELLESRERERRPQGEPYISGGTTYSDPRVGQDLQAGDVTATFSQIGEDGEYYDLIFAAAGAGRAPVLRYLSSKMTRSAIANAGNKRGETPIHIAVRSGSIETVQLLLSYGASLDTYTSEGKSVLAYVQDKKMAEFLREWRKNPLY
ncbi:hypothetical protein Pelo_9392 [Pelomyxa schiedti]|nr:hypothetical protein Pelo_9392 [Pelomyxa schiedti]